MKTKILFLFLVIQTGMSLAQPATEQAFRNASVNLFKDEPQICFTVMRETNVKYYRLEAGNDSLHLGIITLIPSGGNSVLPKNYRFPLIGFEFRYYRICRLEMNGNTTYSGILFFQNQNQ